MRKRKNSKSSKLRCAFCQGKGGQPGAERLSCIVCKGSGRVTVKQPYIICKECGGTGKKKGANLYCLLCRGKGFVEEKRYLSPVESSVSKTKKSSKRRKGKFRKKKSIKKSRKKIRSIKSVKPPPKSAKRRAKADSPKRKKIIKAKVEVKKERKSPPASRLGREVLRAGFFKKLLGTLKIL